MNARMLLLSSGKQIQRSPGPSLTLDIVVSQDTQDVATVLPSKIKHRIIGRAGLFKGCTACQMKGGPAIMPSEAGLAKVLSDSHASKSGA